MANKKVASITRKQRAITALLARLQRHTSRIATNSSPVVISMVNDTAMPYAAASLSEDLKNTTSPMVTPISSQLIIPI